MADTYLAASAAQLKIFEGSINFAYLDSRSNVTYGVGFLLADLQAFQAIPWLTSDNIPAVPTDVATAWAAVRAMTPNRLPGFYAYPGHLVASQATIDAQLQTELTALDAELAQGFTGYTAYPDAAKVALLDMGWNLGYGELYRGYPHMRAAVEAGTWVVAAQQCSREGISPQRNLWTAAQFQSCATV